MVCMGQKSKIVILICYYGQFPWYFPYFLHSCKFNPTIDFIIFSDIECQYSLSPNVKIINKSFREIRELASKKLEISVNIDFPYKLCDFKPAYGLIFEDYTTGYDYWGQSDIDVIYGNIRKFLTEKLLSRYDFVSVRHDYTSGCFAVYRNNYQMNNLFKRSKDYKSVFCRPEHYCFDECNFAWDELTEGKSIFEIKTEIESFTYIIRSAEQRNELRAHFDFILIEGLVGKIKFDRGKVVYKRRYEGILYHLYWLKRVYFPVKSLKNIPDVYYISPSKIYVK